MMSSACRHSCAMGRGTALRVALLCAAFNASCSLNPQGEDPGFDGRTTGATPAFSGPAQPSATGEGTSTPTGPGSVAGSSTAPAASSAAPVSPTPSTTSPPLSTGLPTTTATTPPGVIPPLPTESPTPPPATAEPSEPGDDGAGGAVVTPPNELPDAGSDEVLPFDAQGDAGADGGLVDARLAPELNDAGAP